MRTSCAHQSEVHDIQLYWYEFPRISAWQHMIFCVCGAPYSRMTDTDLKQTGGCCNIKMPSYQYRDSHVKEKTVSPTVLYLTWESPYLVRWSLYWDGDQFNNKMLTHRGEALNISWIDFQWTSTETKSFQYLIQYFVLITYISCENIFAISVLKCINIAPF